MCFPKIYTSYMLRNQIQVKFFMCVCVCVRVRVLNYIAALLFSVILSQEILCCWHNSLNSLEISVTSSLHAWRRALHKSGLTLKSLLYTKTFKFFNQSLQNSQGAAKRFIGFGLKTGHLASVHCGELWLGSLSVPSEFYFGTTSKDMNQ